MTSPVLTVPCSPWWWSSNTFTKTWSIYHTQADGKKWKLVGLWVRGQEVHETWEEDKDDTEREDNTERTDKSEQQDAGVTARAEQQDAADHEEDSYEVWSDGQPR